MIVLFSLRLCGFARNISILFLTLNAYTIYQFNEKIQTYSFRHRMYGSNARHAISQLL